MIFYVAFHISSSHLVKIGHCIHQIAQQFFFLPSLAFVRYAQTKQICLILIIFVSVLNAQKPNLLPFKIFFVAISMLVIGVFQRYITFYFSLHRCVCPFKHSIIFFANNPTQIIWTLFAHERKFGHYYELKLAEIQFIWRWCDVAASCI